MKLRKECIRTGTQPGKLRFMLVVPLRLALALLLLAGLLCVIAGGYWVGQHHEIERRLRTESQRAERWQKRNDTLQAALDRFMDALPPDAPKADYLTGVEYVEALGGQARQHLTIARLFQNREYEACLAAIDTLLHEKTVNPAIVRPVQAQRAWCLHYLGREKEARAAVEQLAKAYPDDPATLQTVADIHLESGRLEEAAPLLRRLVERWPNPLNQYSLAKLLRARKKYVEADAAFRFVIAHGDMLIVKPAVADYALMKIEDELDFPRGNFLANILEQLAPNTLLSQVTFARLFLLQHRLAEAQPLLEQSLKTWPKNLPLLLEMALLHRLAGHNKEAAEFLSRARTLSPDADTRLEQLQAAVDLFRARMQTARPQDPKPGAP